MSHYYYTSTAPPDDGPDKEELLAIAYALGGLCGAGLLVCFFIRCVLQVSIYPNNSVLLSSQCHKDGLEEEELRSEEVESRRGRNDLSAQLMVSPPSL